MRGYALPSGAVPPAAAGRRGCRASGVAVVPFHATPRQSGVGSRHRTSRRPSRQFICYDTIDIFAAPYSTVDRYVVYIDGNLNFGPSVTAQDRYSRFQILGVCSTMVLQGPQGARALARCRVGRVVTSMSMHPVVSPWTEACRSVWYAVAQVSCQRLSTPLMWRRRWSVARRAESKTRFRLVSVQSLSSTFPRQAVGMPCHAMVCRNLDS